MENPDLIGDRVLRFFPPHRGKNTFLVRMRAKIDGGIVKFAEDFGGDGVKAFVSGADVGDGKFLFALLLCGWAVVTL